MEITQTDRKKIFDDIEVGEIFYFDSAYWVCGPADEKGDYPSLCIFSPHDCLWYSMGDIEDWRGDVTVRICRIEEE